MAQVDAGLAVVSKYRLKEQIGDPPNPAAGYGYLYCKADGVFFKQDDGVVIGPFGFGIVPGGRLTLETGEPVSDTDQSAQTTLYYTPYQHNVISLYSNSKWNPVQFTEKSITLVGLIASRPYDVWGYLSGGTLALELLAWTDGTTRATALARQDGTYIKSGDATRRYLGTICINSSGGESEDTLIQRFVWNYYNRIPRKMYVSDDTNHAYETATMRSWNADNSLRLQVIMGVVEDANVIAITQQGEASYVYLGEDSTTVLLDTKIGLITFPGVSITATSGSLEHLIPLGYHYYQALEYGQNGAQQKEVYLGMTFLA